MDLKGFKSSIETFNNIISAAGTKRHSLQVQELSLVLLEAPRPS